VTTDDDARDLLGAYALDAVDDVERRAVERLLARDPDAAREVAGLQATAATLGSAASTTPPAGLRADVLAAIARTPQAAAPERAVVHEDTAEPRDRAGADQHRGGQDAGPDAPVPITRARSARAPRRATTWLAVAATVVGAAVVPSVLAVQQAQRGDRAEQQAQAITELLVDPDATVVRGEVAGGGTAVGVLADDRALFTATGLTEPASGREYQLWVLRDGAALSAGVMDDDDGSVRAVADDFRPGDALAVTVEPAGGSPSPTTDPVVVLTPTEV
jgi:anti-sigma-K factor RskA